MGVHDGHRARMKSRFLEHGPETMHDHEILELLLYYAIPQKDTNPLAHTLLDRFGSLSGVFEAPYEELVKVDGIGDNAATLLKLVPGLSRSYMISRSKYEDILSDTSKAGDFIKNYFFGRQEEAVYVFCLDGKYKVIAVRKLSDGDVSSAGVPIRKLAEYALSSKAAGVILAHNHPSGVVRPSQEDIETTRRVRAALSAVEVPLYDHIIVGNDTYISLADQGYFNP